MLNVERKFLTGGYVFWMVPLGIFLSFIALGIFCGIFCGILAYYCSDTDDDEVDDAKKEDSTIK